MNAVSISLSVLSLVLGIRAQGPTDAKTRLAWHQQHLEMRDASPFKRLRWRHIGPQLMSGRVTEIAAVPGSRYSFYVATASGGLWKTTNEGTSWQPIFDDAPSASVGAVTVAPSQPDTVYVGLGEANIFRSSMSGTGMYRSDDGGETWRHLGLAETHHIARIVVHPKNPEVVWVAASGREWTDNAERGVYKTIDGGKSWRKVLYLGDRIACIDLAAAPDDPDTLYASMWNRIRLKWSDPKPGPGDGVFKSVDGGETWAACREGLPEPKTTGRIGLATCRSAPDVVYAILDNHAVARQPRRGELDSYGRPRKAVIKGCEIYRSDDRGVTWRKVNESSRLMEGVFSTYGWVFGQLRVDPNDVDTVYAMGVPMVKSTDGGKTFRRVSGRGLHGDHHAMWIDPEDSNRVVNGNDGGVNISYDGGRTWKDFPNLPVVQFYNIAVDWQEPFHVYGSIQDNGSWAGPSNHRPGRDPDNDWYRVPGGEASYHQVDPSDPNTLYSESFYGRIQRSTLKPRRTVSIVPKAEEGMPALRGQWLAPFQISPHNPHVIYHGMQHVYRSMDRGEKWERISPDLTTNDESRRGDISFQTITSLSESPVRFGVVYAGTDDGRLHVTRDGGGSWKEIVDGLPAGKFVSRVVASREQESRVWVALNGKRDNQHDAWLYRSDDFGATWQSVADGIPGGPINVVKEDPDRDGVLYVGTDLGVYVTLDYGESWHVLGSRLPIAFVHDLVIHPRDQVAVIATHGRGVWTLDVGKLGDD